MSAEQEHSAHMLTYVQEWCSYQKRYLVHQVFIEFVIWVLICPIDTKAIHYLHKWFYHTYLKVAYVRARDASTTSCRSTHDRVLRSTPDPSTMPASTSLGCPTTGVL